MVNAPEIVSFKDLNLPQSLHESIRFLGFTEPTPIQKQAIPLVLEGRDILGTASTGTGKTGAYSIPIIAKILESAFGNAIILAPTRELAAQVLEVIESLLPRKANIRTALLIGGEPIGRQFKQLRADPRIIVGTPGRINDHLERRSLNLKHTAFLVLDETDRMLDMGFGVQLEEIMKYIPRERQTLMFSATMPKNIIKLAECYLNNPERITIGQAHKPALKIREELIHAKPGAKFDLLLKELEVRKGSIIIFVKTKRGADQLADQLALNHHSADAIHGDLQQRQRDRVIQAFRDKRHRIMVATDVAARGLDIPHIEHVINFDLPQCPEDYIHRIGRTARAGAEGAALSFVSPNEARLWKEIHHLMHGEAPKGAHFGSEPSGLGGKKRGPQRSFRNKNATAEKKRYY